MNASNKFYGEVGYAPTTVTNGVATPKLEKRNYYGDVKKLTTRWESNGNVNDDIRVSHQISILADPYAFENFPYIRYVTWMGTKWEVISATPEYPRIVLSLGGIYNGDPT